MRWLFALFLTVDVLMAIFLFRQAFMERSNMNRKYRIRFLGMLAVLVAALFLQSSNLLLACLVAGLPACLMILFLLAMALALVRHKGPWN